MALLLECAWQDVTKNDNNCSSPYLKMKCVTGIVSVSV